MLTEKQAQASLLDWITDPDPARGIDFARGDGWDHWPYDRLATLAGGVAAGLRARGVRRGQVVSIVQGAGPHFVGTLFGAMLAGAAASPIAPPMTFQDRELYRAHVSGLVRTARPALVVADAGLVERIAEIVGDVPVLPTEEVIAAGEGAPAIRDPGELALLQFTSGSSGHARGVLVPYGALAANVAAIRSWLRMTRDDATATWLPVHHDMGLIGCLITPVVNGSDLRQMPPEEFIRDPARFLRCFDAGGAVLTSMPNFGLGYLARRVRPQALDGLDLSRLRAVIVGAERVDDQVLKRFCRLLEPCGFKRRAVLPAYGLAEGTLAVTGLGLDDAWTTLHVQTSQLRLGGRAEKPAEPAGPGDARQPVIGCGTPMAGVSVTVQDEDGEALDDGVVGEIVVSGESVARGYVTGQSGSSTSIEDGRLRTGDIGFLHEGQLYVLGRLGDSLKLRGRSLFAEDLELTMHHAGVPPHRMAALLGHRSGAATVVAVFEQAQQGWVESALELLPRHAEGAEVVLVSVPRGSIARTSSGKPKRRQLWQAFVNDRLQGTVITGGTS
ncbi:AMP-binding protein [Nonomuraea purpurea]|uniref:AMP-binding protein n=1 Tax=Nonomuraea purpurea TaxID=1849276 RepID=A0ABV8GMJ3_9ACTN